MKNLSFKKLGILFIILLIVVIVVEYYSSNNKAGSFKQELFTLDSSLISKLIITPQSKGESKDVVLQKNNGKWQVKVNQTKLVNIPEGNLERAIAELLKVK